MTPNFSKNICAQYHNSTTALNRRSWRSLKRENKPLLSYQLIHISLIEGSCQRTHTPHLANATYTWLLCLTLPFSLASISTVCYRHKFKRGGLSLENLREGATIKILLEKANLRTTLRGHIRVITKLYTITSQERVQTTLWLATRILPFSSNNTNFKIFLNRYN